MVKNDFNAKYSYGGPTPPCGKNCPDRAAGCSVTCEKWKAYLEERNANYERRKNIRATAAPYTAAGEKIMRQKPTKAANRFRQQRKR